MKEYESAVASQLVDLRVEVQEMIDSDDTDTEDMTSILQEISFRADRLSEEIEKYIEET